MSYQGYYISKTVNGVTSYFNNALLAKSGGWKSTPNQRTDKGSYTDGNGKTHRKILPIKRTTWDLTTKEKITDAELDYILDFFPDIDNVQITFWNEYDREYLQGKFYIVPFEISVDTEDETTHARTLEGLTLHFVEYGQKRS